MRLFYRALTEKRLITGTKARADDHESERDKIRRRRHLTKDGKREQRADEGGDRVIRAGSCRAEQALRINVEKDAEPVRHETNGKHGEHAPKDGDPLPDDKPNDDGACAGEDALQQNDL